MCCGRSRPIAPNRLDAPARGKVLTYQGRTALTVTGPATGFTYRFLSPGASARIDARDLPALLRLPQLRA